MDPLNFETSIKCAPPQLVSTLARLSRAYENIQNFELEIQKWGKSDPPPFRIEKGIDEDQSRYVFKAFFAPMPIRFSTLVGEIIHNLRSSLDHLVWALALKHNSNPAFKIQFPICLKPTNYEKAINTGILKGISKSSCALIEASQPYRARASDPINHPLSIINSLSNHDKHKAPVLVSNLVKMGDAIRISSGENDPKLNIITGISPFPGLTENAATPQSTDVFWLDLQTYTPNFEVHADFEAMITFDEFGNQKRISVGNGLLTLLREADRIVATFFSEF